MQSPSGPPAKHPHAQTLAEEGQNGANGQHGEGVGKRPRRQLLAAQPPQPQQQQQQQQQQPKDDPCQSEKQGEGEGTGKRPRRQLLQQSQQHQQQQIQPPQAQRGPQMDAAGTDAFTSVDIDGVCALFQAGSPPAAQAHVRALIRACQARSAACLLGHRPAAATAGSTAADEPSTSASTSSDAGSVEWAALPKEVTSGQVWAWLHVDSLFLSSLAPRSLSQDLEQQLRDRVTPSKPCQDTLQARKLQQEAQQQGKRQGQKRQGRGHRGEGREERDVGGEEDGGGEGAEPPLLPHLWRLAARPEFQDALRDQLQLLSRSRVWLLLGCWDTAGQLLAPQQASALPRQVREDGFYAVLNAAALAGLEASAKLLLSRLGKVTVRADELSFGPGIGGWPDAPLLSGSAHKQSMFAMMSHAEHEQPSTAGPGEGGGSDGDAGPGPSSAAVQQRQQQPVSSSDPSSPLPPGTSLLPALAAVVCTVRRTLACADGAPWLPTVSALYVSNFSPLGDRATKQMGFGAWQPPTFSVLTRELAQAVTVTGNRPKHASEYFFSRVPSLDKVEAWPADCLLASTLLDDAHRLLLPKEEITVMEGVNAETVILSQALTSTSVHKEDGEAGSRNTLLGPQSKTWTFVPRTGAASRRVEERHRRAGTLDALRSKQFFGGLEGEEGAVCVVQVPGVTFTTLPGCVWHQTTSAGPSLALSLNYLSHDAAAKAGVRAMQGEVRAAAQRGLRWASLHEALHEVYASFFAGP